MRPEIHSIHLRELVELDIRALRKEFEPGPELGPFSTPGPFDFFATFRDQRVDMCCTCSQYPLMAKMIQLRHVPDDLHRKLKARAVQQGLSLTDYLLGEVRRIAESPTLAEMRDRLARRKPVTLTENSAQAVRAERDAR